MEHQRELGEEERKRYLLMLDLDTNEIQLKSLARSFGPRVGSIMRKLIASALPSMSASEIRFYRFENHEGLDGTTLTDDVNVLDHYNLEGVYKKYLALRTA